MQLQKCKLVEIKANKLNNEFLKTKVLILIHEGAKRHSLVTSIQFYLSHQLENGNPTAKFLGAVAYFFFSETPSALYYVMMWNINNKNYKTMTVANKNIASV